MIPANQTVWYAAGQMYTLPDNLSFDVGYFASINGIDAPFFENDKTFDSTAAYFTFSAIKDPFPSAVGTVGQLGLGQNPPGEWEMYYNEQPCANFDNPISFSTDRDGNDAANSNTLHHIATFRRVMANVGAATSAIGTSILSFELVSSSDFVAGGIAYNMRDLVPNGVTQWGTGDPTPLDTLGKYTKRTAFLGSAVAVGG